MTSGTIGAGELSNRLNTVQELADVFELDESEKEALRARIYFVLTLPVLCLAD